MEIVKPKKLRPAATIGIIAPSSYCTPEDSAKTKVELEKIGYHVFIHPQCLARDHMSAGTPEEKITALHDVFSNPEIDAVFCLRGGYQTLNMIDQIDYALIRANPKILMGYSDITALHGVFLRKTGLVTFHGPNANGFGELSSSDEKQKPYRQNNLAALEFLSGAAPANLFRDYPSRTIREGRAESRLIGGNLQLLTALIEAGNKYCPSFDGKILMLEDIGEEITKIERQFSSLRLRGIFKNLAGLIIGHMTDIKDTPGRAGSFVYDLEAVIRRHIHELQGPVIMNAPFGHEVPNYVFPQGVRAALSAGNAHASLVLLESPFSDG